MRINSFKVGQKVYHKSQRMTLETEPFTVRDRKIVLNNRDQDTYLISYGNITMLVGVNELSLATDK